MEVLLFAVGNHDQPPGFDTLVLCDAARDGQPVPQQAAAYLHM